MSSSSLRVGLIGAGYIASWHADAIAATPNIDLSAVCDPSVDQAQALAHNHGARVFYTLEDLIEAQVCDAVHILTPPDLHRDLAIQCLQAGLHVLVEKPVALSAKQTQDIEDAAQLAGRRFHAGHNFLGLPSYETLKKQVARGALGRISAAEFRWSFPLSPLRSGPYSLWLLREPQNLLLELAPHLVAYATDLFGDITIEHVNLAKPVDLPGGETRPQSWRILARAGQVDVTFILSLVETVDDRSVTLHGSTARGRLDFASDTLLIDGENTSDLVLNPLRRQMSLGWQSTQTGSVNAARQLLSLNKKSPYGLSFLGMLKGVYDPLLQNKPADPRFSGAQAVKVMRVLDQTLDQITFPSPAPHVQTRKPRPKAMVIGGTGFIGRALTRALVEDGSDVRVISRGRHGPFGDLLDQVETVGLSLRDTDGLAEAMQGIDTVYNLARSVDTSWADCLTNDVAISTGIANASLQAGVKRLIYTGTIASYDMSDPTKTITEQTGFADDMRDRNLYARSKAECERQLLAMHRDQGLPLVIARPGIVVGKGGPLQHWGIGRWHGAGAVRIWGNGQNILPFVLINDTTRALIQMTNIPDLEGESYNLIGDPQFSALAYFDAIHDALGARIRVGRGNLRMMYAADSFKHLLKTRVLGRQGLTRPSLADWQSRAHLSPFDNQKAKSDLNWTPVADRAGFIREAISEANLFGF
jgi:predicted dehydrogenase/nucleoside-diphosphate-sugar epimerase